MTEQVSHMQANPDLNGGGPMVYCAYHNTNCPSYEGATCCTVESLIFLPGPSFWNKNEARALHEECFVCEEGQSLERAWLQRGLRTTQGGNRSEPADTQHCRDAMEIDNSVWFKSAV